MKKSDQLLKSALAAKAGETEEALNALERMTSASKARIEQLGVLKKKQLEWLNHEYEARHQALSRQMVDAKAEYDRAMANLETAFAELTAQEEQNLQDLSDFERRQVKGFTEAEGNTPKKEPLKVVTAN